MLSRHRFCCYIVFAQHVTLTLVRVSHFTHYPIITLAYIDYFTCNMDWIVDILVDFGPMCPGFVSRESHDFFFFFF